MTSFTEVFDLRVQLNRAKLIVALAVYAIVSFVFAGLLANAFPDQSLAIILGWMLAAYLAGRLLEAHFLD